MDELNDAGSEYPARSDAPDPGRVELLDILNELGPGGDFGIERLLDRVVARAASR